MLFINPIHLIISVAFSSSVTPCFFAISFIRYSAISRAEVSISARCSYNFPLISRLKHSTRLCIFQFRTVNFIVLLKYSPHASNILFLIIQYRDNGIAMYHKPFLSLTNRILFIKKYSGDFGNHDFSDVHFTSPEYRPASD